MGNALRATSGLHRPLAASPDRGQSRDASASPPPDTALATWFSSSRDSRSPVAHSVTAEVSRAQDMEVTASNAKGELLKIGACEKPLRNRKKKRKRTKKKKEVRMPVNCRDEM